MPPRVKVDGPIDIGVEKDAENRLIISPDVKPVTRISSSGAVAISLRSAKEGKQFRFIQVTIKFNTLPTTSEDVTLTLKSGESGVSGQYDVVLARVDPSTGTGTGDVVIQGEANDIFTANDELLLEYTNTDTRTYGARIVLEPSA